MTLALQQELDFFKANKSKWLEQGLSGKFVVIKGNEMFDYFSSHEDALRQGLRKYGDVPFLIKQVQQYEQVFHFFHGVEVRCPA